MTDENPYKPPGEACASQTASAKENAPPKSLREIVWGAARFGAATLLVMYSPGLIVSLVLFVIDARKLLQNGVNSEALAKVVMAALRYSGQAVGGLLYAAAMGGVIGAIVGVVAGSVQKSIQRRRNAKG